jgi:hypothetical protein
MDKIQCNLLQKRSNSEIIFSFLPFLECSKKKLNKSQDHNSNNIHHNLEEQLLIIVILAEEYFNKAAQDKTGILGRCGPHL